MSVIAMARYLGSLLCKFVQDFDRYCDIARRACILPYSARFTKRSLPATSTVDTAGEKLVMPFTDLHVVRHRDLERASGKSIYPLSRGKAYPLRAGRAS